MKDAESQTLSQTQTQTETQTDVMDPARAQALQAALGMPVTLSHGDALPDFFHQVYFWMALGEDQLGRDGHPKRGVGIIPDLGLPRRMWAGGRLHFHQPLRLGTQAVCETSLLRVSQKDGQSGPLGLVTVRMDYSQNGALCVREERELIYREDMRADAPKPKTHRAPAEFESETPLSFSTTQLFRYSALTFNGHRIHYDLNYAQGIEGYGGLVVHGPLLAQILMSKAADELGPLKDFRFRATAPLLHFEGASACRLGHKLWITGPAGRLCMEAEAET